MAAEKIETKKRDAKRHGRQQPPPCASNPRGAHLRRAKLLDAHDMIGDETVMAEWRTLVQAEKEKSNHATVRGPAGDYVHSKRWGA